LGNEKFCENEQNRTGGLDSKRTNKKRKRKETHIVKFDGFFGFHIVGNTLRETIRRKEKKIRRLKGRNDEKAKRDLKIEAER
jgi:hypothetical protein